MWRTRRRSASTASIRSRSAHHTSTISQPKLSKPPRACGITSPVSGDTVPGEALTFDADLQVDVSEIEFGNRYRPFSSRTGHSSTSRHPRLRTSPSPNAGTSFGAVAGLAVRREVVRPSERRASGPTVRRLRSATSARSHCAVQNRSPLSTLWPDAARWINVTGRMGDGDRIDHMSVRLAQPARPAHVHRLGAPVALLLRPSTITSIAEALPNPSRRWSARCPLCRRADAALAGSEYSSHRLLLPGRRCAGERQHAGSAYR